MMEKIKLPEILIDDEGQPSEQFLDWIKNYDIVKNGVDNLLSVIFENWMYKDQAYKYKRIYKGFRILELHTIGWSSNEAIIDALEQNNIFFLAYWFKSEKGGHYYFKIPKNKK